MKFIVIVLLKATVFPEAKGVEKNQYLTANSFKVLKHG